MSDSIFKLTVAHANWIAQRREVIAGNISNVDQPGFKVREVSPFSVALEASGSALVTTSSMHQQSEPTYESVANETEVAGNARHSGNNVDIEREMLKAGETARDHAMNVAIARSFHRMFMNSVKG